MAYSRIKQGSDRVVVELLSGFEAKKVLKLPPEETISGTYDYEGCIRYNDGIEYHDGTDWIPLGVVPVIPTIYSPLGIATGNNTVLLDNTARRNFKNIANTFDLGFGTVSGFPYVRLYSYGGVTVGSGSTFATSKFANLQTDNLTASRNFQFPDATGILPLRVNGVSADILGNITIPIGGSGTVTSVGISSADLSVISSPITSAGTIGLNINSNAVTNAKIRQSSGLSIVGRSINSIGNVADIVAGTDGHILRRNGATLAFGTIGDSSIIDLAYSKLTGTPTIPTVSDATLTLATSGIASGSQTFTANSATNKTFTVSVPSTLSSYTNDVGFLTTVAKNTTPNVQIIPNPTEGYTTAGVGQIIISHPNIPTNTMLDYTIKMQVYGAQALGEIRVSLYRGGGSTFTTALTAYVTANNKSGFNNLITLGNIRVGYNALGHLTVVLGDVGYNWGGTNITWHVENVTASISGGSLLVPTGWDSSFNNTALTGYTSLTNIPTELTYPTVFNLSGTYAVGVTSIPANSQITLGTVTITGASTNDVIEVTQPSLALLFKAKVTATNTVTLYALNPTAASINTVAETLKIRIIK